MDYFVSFSFDKEGNFPSLETDYGKGVTLQEAIDKAQKACIEMDRFGRLFVGNDVVVWNDDGTFCGTDINASDHDYLIHPDGTLDVLY